MNVGANLWVRPCEIQNPEANRHPKPETICYEDGDKDIGVMRQEVVFGIL